MKTVLVILALFLLEIAAKGLTSRHSPKYRIKHYHYHHRARLPRVLNRPKVHIAPQPLVLPEIKHIYHYCSDHPQSIEHPHIPASEHSFQVPKATIIRPPVSLDSETGPASGEYFKNFENLINVVGNQHESEPPTHQQPHGWYEFVEIPDVHSPPLEDDATKASYDTPGAVNSYGTPVMMIHRLPTRKEPKKRPSIEQFFDVELNDADFYPQYEFKRSRKQSSERTRNRNVAGDEVRHPNHRYD